MTLLHRRCKTPFVTWLLKHTKPHSRVSQNGPCSARARCPRRFPCLCPHMCGNGMHHIVPLWEGILPPDHFTKKHTFVNTSMCKYTWPKEGLESRDLLNVCRMDPRGLGKTDHNGLSQQKQQVGSRQRRRSGSPAQHASMAAFYKLGWQLPAFYFK